MEPKNHRNLSNYNKIGYTFCVIRVFQFSFLIYMEDITSSSSHNNYDYHDLRLIFYEFAIVMTYSHT